MAMTARSTDVAWSLEPYPSMSRPRLRRHSAFTAEIIADPRQRGRSLHQSFFPFCG